MLYRKDLKVMPILNIASDRICGIRVEFPSDSHDRTIISVLGVYLPCLDKGIESYREHIIELENLISDSQHFGAVVIAGDFNAHIGCLGGLRGEGQPNHQGLLVKDLIDRCSLHVLSLSGRAEGPNYTFWNSTSETTVDYIIGDIVASNAMVNCRTHECSPFNTSDHLPITAKLCLENKALPIHHPRIQSERVNWKIIRSPPA